MIEVKRRKPAKPPEDRVEAKTADKSKNWRTKATVVPSIEETDEDEDEALPELTQERNVKVAEVVDENDDSGDAVVELPYKGVPPIDHDQGRDENPTGLPEKAYRVRAPVQKEGLGNKLTNKLMDAEISIRIKDLLGASPEVRDNAKARLTKTRQPYVTAKGKEKAVFHVEEEPLPFYEAEEKLEYDALNIDDIPRVTSVYITTTATSEFPLGSIMIPDPYMQYLATLDPGEVPKQVYVARDSAPLRTIYPRINHLGKIESVTDSGSQIVSMSYEQALASRVQWDPDLQIYMQSANKTIEKSVGLAKNVAFEFGDILVYLQVHIIRGAAYKVLLGRPFEILTASTIQNSTDGSQTITIKDPNSGRRCTMPTYTRDAPEGSTGTKRATVEEVPDEEEKSSGKTADSEPVQAGFHQSSMN